MGPFRPIECRAAESDALFRAEQFHARLLPNNAIRLNQNRLALVGEESVSVGHRRQRPGINQETIPMRIYIIGNDGITLCHEAPESVH